LQTELFFSLLVTYRSQPLIAAEATTFVLIQKVAKNQVSRKASLPHMPCPANQAKPGLLYFYPAVATHLPLPFCKNLLCPALALRATIVLPDFTRSCSADGNYLSLRAIAWQPRRILYVSDEVASSFLLAMTF